jgi:RNA polymerase sigma-70 factor (ECF subfamily)
MHAKAVEAEAIRDMRSGAPERHEEWLIDRIVEEDRDAFGTLYRTYFPRLIQFLRRLSRNAQLTEEIVNDTMLVVWQKAHTYNRSSKVSTWIFAIAYRQALKRLRRVDEPVMADFEDYPGGLDSEPDHGLNALQMKKLVGSALDALPIEQRSVVALTYYHGMGYEEIAKTMDCPVNTVKTRMFHARRKLKTLLSAYQEAL